jgi:hypothetical protein
VAGCPLLQPAQVWSDLEFGEQFQDPETDMVTDGSYILQSPARRIIHVPVFVLLSRVERAGVSATHGDHHVGCIEDLFRPKALPELSPDDLVISVCDRAHDALIEQGDVRELHWSVPDPAGSESVITFDRTTDVLADRIASLELCVSRA